MDRKLPAGAGNHCAKALEMAMAAYFQGVNSIHKSMAG
jgi:hypothetical protein